ncbi:MAG: hypothetical protein OXH50_06890, partial [Gemmatimonadetes bacterium]|nr:hypothetical protein [Gemmatimonadota bacterium]
DGGDHVEDYGGVRLWNTVSENKGGIPEKEKGLYKELEELKRISGMQPGEVPAPALPAGAAARHSGPSGVNHENPELYEQHPNSSYPLPATDLDALMVPPVRYRQFPLFANPPVAVLFWNPVFTPPTSPLHRIICPRESAKSRTR